MTSGFFGVCLQFLSQSADQNIDGAVEGGKFTAARDIKEHIPGKRAPGIFYECDQQVVFCGREGNILTFAIVQVTFAGVNREAFELQRIDPRDAVEGALSIVTERLRLYSIDLSVDMPDSCPKVIGHVVQLEQVLLNILGNAFDALEARNMAEGAKSIDIRLATRDKDGSI